MNDDVIKKILDSHPIHCKSSYGSFGTNVLPRGPYLQYKHHNQIEAKKRTIANYVLTETFPNYHNVNTLGRKPHYNGQIPSMSKDIQRDKVESISEVPKFFEKTQTRQNNDDNQQIRYPYVKHVYQTNIFDNNYSTRTKLSQADNNGNLYDCPTGAVPIRLNQTYFTELEQNNDTQLKQIEGKYKNSLNSMHREDSQTSVTLCKRSTEKTENYNLVHGETSCPVSLSDITLVKFEGLNEDVGWAILCQSVQALQDMFLADCPIASKYLPILKSSSIQFTSRGRIVFKFSKVINEPINHYLAPEYFINQQTSHYYSELDIEKMWIYSLGITLHKAIQPNLSVKFIKEKYPRAKRTTGNRLNAFKCMEEITSNSIKKDKDVLVPPLQEVIETMCDQNPSQRASIMTLLNLNPQRSALRRPPQVIDLLNPSFDNSKFNFTKIDVRERLVTFKYENSNVTFIINKSPLTKYHSLICVDLEKKLPQKITEESLRFCIQFLLQINDRNFRIGYNSPGAFASVNHLHLHLIYLQQVLFIENVVITSYFRSMQNKRPVSHLIMDLLKEVSQKKLEKFCFERNVEDRESPCKEITSSNILNNNKDFVKVYQPQLLKRNDKIIHRRNDIRRNTIDINLNDLEKATKQHLRFQTKLKDSVSKSDGHLNKENCFQLQGECKDGNVANLYNCPEFILKLSQPSKLIKLSKTFNRQAINVILVNSENIEIICDYSSTTISDIFEAIIETEKYSDKFMLGLCSIIGGDFIFLPPNLKLIKIFPINKGYSFFTLFLRVKFLLPTLDGLNSLQSRHMLYLQLRKSIIERQLHCDQDALITLAGFALQAEVGDYSEMMHGKEYFSIAYYMPEKYLFRNRNLRNSLTNAHYLLRGMSKREAEQSFIQTVQKLKHYGYHLFSANWVKNMNTSISIYVGISLNGMALFERNESNTALFKDHSSTKMYRKFEWLEIQNLCFSKENLFITTRSRENLNIKDDELIKFKIELKDKKSSYAFYLASDHHKFYLQIKKSLLTNQQSDDKNILTSIFSAEKQSGNSPNQDNIKQEPKQSINKCLNKFGKFLKRSNSNICHMKTTKPCETLFSIKNYFKTKQKSHSLTRINFGEVFENQNNENNECSKLEQKLEPDDLHIPQIGNSPERNRVKMGTRVFSTLCLSNLPETLSEQTNKKNLSIDEDEFAILSFNEKQNIIVDNKDCDSLYDVIDECESNEAYVINSSIKSDDIDEHVANHIALPINETISDSILESLKNHIFTDRILKSVTIVKQPILIHETTYKNQDNNKQTQNSHILTKKYTLGISIVQGSENNNVYVKDLLKNGPGKKAGIKIGDQIVAVDGISILNLPYSESLKILQKTNYTVELVVSQIINVNSHDTNLINNSRKSAIYKTSPNMQNQFIGTQKISETVNKTIESQYATVRKKSKSIRNGNYSRKYSGPVRYPVTPLKPNIKFKL